MLILKFVGASCYLFITCFWLNINIFLVLWGGKNLCLSFYGFLHIGHSGVFFFFFFFFNLLSSLLCALFMSFLPLNFSYIICIYLSYFSSNHIFCCFHLFMGVFTSSVFFSIFLFFSCYIFPLPVLYI